jgi:hypothetical protein
MDKRSRDLSRGTSATLRWRGIHRVPPLPAQRAGVRRSHVADTCSEPFRTGPFSITPPLPRAA